MGHQDARIGTILNDRYLLLERLGEGTMATVYRAERLKLKRSVAVKFLRESFAIDEDGRRRFEVEARAMSRLEHPNCVSVSDFGVELESPYLVLDYVAGLTLRQVMQIQAGPMPARRALDIVKQVLAGLSHAHHHGIVHRDMKPDNVLVTEIAGHGEQARIADFGLAKLRDDVTVTTGVALGTPSYMSPEQTVGESADARTDIYAVGIILFELLIGRKPFHAESPFDLMRFHRESPVPSLASSHPDLAFSRQMEAIIQTALAKPRERRFDSAATFLQALDSAPEAQPGGYQRKSWWQFWR